MKKPLIVLPRDVGDKIDINDATAKALREHSKTNADRIRAMTDEEIAEFIIWKAQTFGNSDYCIIECDNGDCKECALDWLQQPAKEAHK